MNKKGITPLMATVLLVSFAVALGVVVMNFGRAQVEDDASCPVELGLAFAEISGSQDVCFDGNNLKFTVENGVNSKITGLIVNVIGQDRAQTFELNDAQIARAGTYLGQVSFSESIRQVKISPKIDFTEEDFSGICIDQAVVAENIANC